MKVTITVDDTAVVNRLAEAGVLDDGFEDGGFHTTGSLDDVIAAVTKSVKFEFDRVDVDAVVLQFPELSR